MSTIVVTSGGFDPVHLGHISYLAAARALGDFLIVGVNSDAWLTRKKGRAFMSFAERRAIVHNLKSVDAAIQFDDTDGSAVALLDMITHTYPDDQIIFANGGDRTADNIPEMSVSNVEFVFGIGGTSKANSSSALLDQWTRNEVIRSWGSYNILQDIPGAKVKTLTVLPGQALSMQRHQLRSEYWMVTEGTCMVNMALPGVLNNPPRILTKYNEFHVPTNTWHQLTNPFTKPCTIIEIQYGERCDETDIERLDTGC
jgi:D-beta-D-heptose 7-phosphate kinase/D-beta-D-heptose 1-phosphate adenosyltransferase